MVTSTSSGGNAPAPVQTQTQNAPNTPAQQPHFTIVPFKKLLAHHFLKLIVYGKYGAGKTTFAGSAVDVPEMRDVIMISAEAGETSLDDSPVVKDSEFLDVIRINKFSQLSYIRDFLEAHIIFRDNENEEKLRALQQRVFGAGTEAGEGRLRKYKTVIIDSLSEIDAYCMAALLGIHEGFSWNADMPAAEFKEYKQNFNKMQMLIRGFRDLKMNVLFTCAAVYDKDEMQKMHFMPNLTGKLSNVVQGFFDVVGFLDTGSATEDKDAPRRLWLQPVGGRFDAKTRLAGYKKSFLDNPTMSSLYQAAQLAKKSG